MRPEIPVSRQAHVANDAKRSRHPHRRAVTIQHAAGIATPAGVS